MLPGKYTPGPSQSGVLCIPFIAINTHLIRCNKMHQEGADHRISLSCISYDRDIAH